MEVPVQPKSPSDDLSEEETPRQEKEMADVPKHRQARAVLSDPCSPDPCLNGGVCVVEKHGKATCRCVYKYDLHNPISTPRAQFNLYFGNSVLQRD